MGVVLVPDLGSVFIGCRARVLGFGLRPGPWEVTMTTRPIAGDRELVPVAEPLVSDGERAALAGFLAGCSELTPLSIVDGAIQGERLQPARRRRECASLCGACAGLGRAVALPELDAVSSWSP